MNSTLVKGQTTVLRTTLKAPFQRVFCEKSPVIAIA
jgi:hypothetical protein